MKWMSTSKNALTCVLAANMVPLMCLIVLAFVLPLSTTQRWTLVLAEAFLFGLNAALLSHARKKAKRAKDQRRGPSRNRS